MNIDEVLERINDEIKKEYLEDKRVERVIKFCSALCAGIALQPIPIADFPILTTIEVAMVVKKYKNLYSLFRMIFNIYF